MITRLIHDADLQAVFRFFGAMTLDYYKKHQVIPPACVLVWLKRDLGALDRLHQFPAPQVANLLKTEKGRQGLAHSIRTILDPSAAREDAPEGPRPHLVVQVLHAHTPVMDAAGGPDQEVLMMLAHTQDTTYATAIPLVSPVVPHRFDITATDVA